MEATQTQMNVRIDAGRKAGGDAVLAKFGLNPTFAVRALWDYLDEHEALPDFMAESRNADGCAEKEALATFAALAEEGAGMAVRLAQRAGIACESLQGVSYWELRDAAYEERFEEWDARDV